MKTVKNIVFLFISFISEGPVPSLISLILLQIFLVTCTFCFDGLLRALSTDMTLKPHMTARSEQ